MCHDSVGGPDAGRAVPSRRAFSRFLLAGSGLAGLAACTPGTPQPAGSGPATTTAAVPPPSAAVTASASPVPDSTPAAVPGTPPAGAAPSATAPGPQHSLTDPASQWVVVNKHRPLSPATFVPADLVRPGVRLATSGEAALLNRTTAAAAEAMFAAAAADGVTLTLASGYRSFTTQSATYNNWVGSKGQAEADTASARPGYSEHQTGWSFDIGDGSGLYSFRPEFAGLPAAVWAKANAPRFGFVVRYPWMFHDITGYYYEPWHLRFIGVEAATDMTARGIATLEEYFGLEAAPAYR